MRSTNKNVPYCFLTRWTAAVQEPCLLAMLRIAADCEEIPLEVTKTISEAGQNAGRHIRRVSQILRSIWCGWHYAKDT